MSEINDAAEDNAAKSATGRHKESSKSRKRPRAAGGNIARQKANQSDRKSSGRKFKLSPEALKALRAEKGKGLVVPYRAGSAYAACIRALQRLEANRWHSLDKLAAAVVTEMGSEKAKAFKAKEKRNDKTGKGWKERIVQNAKVLTRPDYGAKLRQVGYQLRTDTEKGAGLFKLPRK